GALSKPCLPNNPVFVASAAAGQPSSWPARSLRWSIPALRQACARCVFTVLTDGYSSWLLSRLVRRRAVRTRLQAPRRHRGDPAGAGMTRSRHPDARQTGRFDHCVQPTVPGVPGLLLLPLVAPRSTVVVTGNVSVAAAAGRPDARRNDRTKHHAKREQRPARAGTAGRPALPPKQKKKGISMRISTTPPLTPAAAPAAARPL